MPKDKEDVDDNSAAYNSLLSVLEQTIPDAEQRVRKSVTQWNNIVREYLRNETGLRLSVGTDAVGVPIHFVRGLPAAFSDAVQIITAPLDWRLILSEGLLKTTGRGLDFLLEYVTDAAHQPEQHALFSNEQESLETSRALVTNLTGKIASLKLRERLAAIHEDVLGAYFYNKMPRPEVHLYWMVIGAVSAMLDVSVESLTVIVLAHELTHAYTHLGRDIDGHRWNTQAFAKSDPHILEGLAQYYTEVICQNKLSARYPSAAKAYEGLLKMQSGPYLVHREWVIASPLRGEAIRAAMIVTRSTGNRELGYFMDRLERYVQEARRA